MAGMGLDTAFGAAGASDAMQQLFEQRIRQAESDRAQKRMEQDDALQRIKLAEQAENVRLRLEASKQADADRAQTAKFHADDVTERATERQFTMTPAGQSLEPTLGARAQTLGFPVSKIAGDQVKQTTGFLPMPSAPPTGPGMQTVQGLTPVGGPQMSAGQSTTSADPSSPLNAPDRFTRGATQADVVKQKADELANRKADDASQARADALELRQHIADITEKVRSGQLNNQEAMLAIRERLASVAEQNASAKATKGLTLSQGGKSALRAIEGSGPLTDKALALMEKEFPGIDKNPEQYNTLLDKGSSLLHAGKYALGFSDENDPRQQIVSLLKPIQAGQYTQSSRSYKMVELALQHMADMKQTPARQYEAMKHLRELMPELRQGVIRAEQPVDPANPLGGSYFDPAKPAGTGGQEFDYVPGKGLVPRKP